MKSEDTAACEKSDYQVSIPAYQSAIRYDAARAPSIQYVPAKTTGHPSLMGFHRHLLEDTARTGAFIDAIARIVRPGDVVADLGAGTGILTMACVRAGARRVYAIESAEIIAAAHRAIRANGMEQHVTFLRDLSSRVTLPEKVDVVVSECLGMMGFSGTSMLFAVQELARRSLKDNGRVIPQSVSAFIVPIESSLHYDYVHVWEARRLYDFDFAAFQTWANNNTYIAWFDESHFLAAPQSVATRQVMVDDLQQINARLQFTPARAGVLHGYGGWFRADLGNGVMLDASPRATPTIWKHLYLPLEQAVQVQPDQAIELNLCINTSSGWPAYLLWNTRVLDQCERTIVAFEQSTLKSTPKP